MSPARSSTCHLVALLASCPFALLSIDHGLRLQLGLAANEESEFPASARVSAHEPIIESDVKPRAPARGLSLSRAPLTHSRSLPPGPCSFPAHGITYCTACAHSESLKQGHTMKPPRQGRFALTWPQREVVDATPASMSGQPSHDSQRTLACTLPLVASHAVLALDLFLRDGTVLSGHGLAHHLPESTTRHTDSTRCVLENSVRRLVVCPPSVTFHRHHHWA